MAEMNVGHNVLSDSAVTNLNIGQMTCHQSLKLRWEVSLSSHEYIDILILASHFCITLQKHRV